MDKSKSQQVLGSIVVSIPPVTGRTGFNSPSGSGLNYFWIQILYFKTNLLKITN